VERVLSLSWLSSVAIVFLSGVQADASLPSERVCSTPVLSEVQGLPTIFGQLIRLAHRIYWCITHIDIFLMLI